MLSAPTTSQSSGSRSRMLEAATVCSSQRIYIRNTDNEFLAIFIIIDRQLNNRSLIKAHSLLFMNRGSTAMAWNCWR